jgi:tetratricopeptide (TPR) repeat protein
MGEIFAVEQPAAPLQFTGERMTSDARGQIEYEHLHRYCFARMFCRGRDVVDAAAGEGYGAALLAQVANRVIGVEMAEDAVAHALATYARPNLRFLRGDVRRLPLRDNSADVVVSFETIEHLFEHEAFLAEIRRVLRPHGLLVISSPDSEVYSYTGSDVNPFHVHELTAGEFKTAIATVFPHAHFYSQRALIGSAITVDGPNQGVLTFERRSEEYVDAARGLPHAPYILAVASAAALDEPCQTLYVDLTRDAQLLTSRFGGRSIAEHLSALETEAVTLRGALEQRDAALALANSQAAENAAHAKASAARESLAAAEVEKQHIEIRDLSRQRDNAQLAAAEAVHVHIAELREALTAAEREAQEREAQFQLAEREVVRMREALTTAEWKIEQQGAAVETSQRELAELRAALAEAERKRQEQEYIMADLKVRLAQGAGLVGHLRGRARSRGVGAAIRAGDRAARSGNWAEAGRCYQHALDQAPGLAPIWVQLGHMLKEQGDYAGAETAYRRALVLDGSVADTHLQLGHLLKLQSRWDEAADAYNRACQLDSTLGEAGQELDALCQFLIDEGDRARDAKNWAVAAGHYKRALDRQPDLMGIWVQLGHALKEQGDYSGAEGAYRRALAIDDSLPDTHLQLGHLFKLQARRPEAIDAYAVAIRLDPEFAAAHDALRTLVGYSPSETERALHVDGETARLEDSGRTAAFTTSNGMLAPAGANGAATNFRFGGRELTDRYGPLVVEASGKAPGTRDIIWLGVIDWHFRIQRPQHLASNLANSGARVFYISLVFEPADREGRFRIIESPHLGVFEVRLRLWSDPAESIYQGLSDAAVGELQLALDEVIAVLGIRAPVVLVEYPTWHKVACGIPGATIVYDCLDLATGFNNAPTSLASL